MECWTGMGCVICMRRGGGWDTVDEDDSGYMML